MSADIADPLFARGAALLHSGLDEHLEVFRRLPALAAAIQQAAVLMAESLSQGGKTPENLPVLVEP